MGIRRTLPLAKDRYPVAVDKYRLVRLLGSGAMGAVFSHLSRAASTAGLGFGRALGVNMLAAAAAPAVCGVIAVPALGPKSVLLLIAVGYLAAATRHAWTRPTLWLPAMATLALAVFALGVIAAARQICEQEGASLVPATW